jgi:hypothetical protein
MVLKQPTIFQNPTIQINQLPPGPLLLDTSCREWSLPGDRIARGQSVSDGLVIACHGSTELSGLAATRRHCPQSPERLQRWQFANLLGPKTATAEYPTAVNQGGTDG